MAARVAARQVASPSSSAGRDNAWNRGAVSPLGGEPRPQKLDRLTVFAVDQQPAAAVGDGGHGLEEFSVVDPDGGLVGQIGLEGRHAFLFETTVDRRSGLLAPPGHRHVEGVVARRACRLLLARRQRGEKVVAALRVHEVDDRRRAAGDGRRGAGLEIVRGDCASHRQGHVDVRVDAAREDMAVAGVDDLLAGRLEAGTDFDDSPVMAAHVAGPAA